jgi:hypothetical protein
MNISIGNTVAYEDADLFVVGRNSIFKERAEFFVKLFSWANSA